MTAQDYPVTFGYLKWLGDYLHRGLDRAMQKRTPVEIRGTIIGLSGNTGKTTGPHLHTQSGPDEWCQETVNPKNHEFKSGTVIHAGHGTEWGNFVIIKGSDGFYTCYAHLSEILVQPGQKVGRMGLLTKLRNALTLNRDALALTRKALKNVRAERDELANRLNDTQDKLSKALSSLSERPTIGEYKKMADRASELEKQLRDAQNETISREDWSSLWDKILSFFKKG